VSGMPARAPRRRGFAWSAWPVSWSRVPTAAPNCLHRPSSVWHWRVSAVQACCHHGLGTLYQRTGNVELRHEHLARAAATYGEMHTTFWLQQFDDKASDLITADQHMQGSTAPLGAPGRLVRNSPELLHEPGVVVAPPRQAHLDLETAWL
jgi:hypothetical protein